MLGHLERAQPEQRQRLEQDDRAGDDRRRAVGVEPAHLPALVQRQPGQPLEDPPALRRAHARSPRPCPGRRARAPGRSTPSTSRCPPPRSRAPPIRRRSLGHAGGRGSRGRRAPARRARPAVGGSECRWRSVWRTTPAWLDTWKVISRPVPITNSVEPPPMSITSVGVRSLGIALAGGAEEREPRLLVSGQDVRFEPPPVTDRVERTPRRWRRP